MEINKDHCTRIYAFLKNPKNFLVIIGDPGVGKSYICAAMFEWAIRNFHCFRYYDEQTLLEKLRKVIDENMGDYHKEMVYLLDDDMIFLDDIGSTRQTDWTREVLFSAFDERYNTMKPTVITSNLTREEFKTFYHPRVYSRLFASENTIIDLDGCPDLRAEGK